MSAQWWRFERNAAGEQIGVQPGRRHRWSGLTPDQSEEVASAIAQGRSLRDLEMDYSRRTVKMLMTNDLWGALRASEIAFYLQRRDVQARAELDRSRDAQSRMLLLWPEANPLLYVPGRKMRIRLRDLTDSQRQARAEMLRKSHRERRAVRNQNESATSGTRRGFTTSRTDSS